MTERPDINDYRNRCERAEAECKELRERLERARIAVRIEALRQAISIAAPGEAEWVTQQRAEQFIHFTIGS